ncbi:MAG: hypothetical protein KGL39_48390 [Patescibacteria group bacterium]|nr:hypothetical protein [Patescibacteria group bacterium]
MTDKITPTDAEIHDWGLDKSREIVNPRRDMHGRLYWENGFGHEFRAGLGDEGIFRWNSRTKNWHQTHGWTQMEGRLKLVARLAAARARAS